MAESMTRTRMLTLVRWGCAAVFIIGSALALRFGHPLNDLTALPYLVYFVIGLLVSVRRPENPMGWLFLAISVLTGLNGAIGAVTVAAEGTAHESAWYILLAAWAYNFVWLLLLSTSVVFTLLLFPDGLPTSRWRPVLWAAILSTAGGVVCAALSPDVMVGDTKHPNPVHPGPWGPVLTALFAVSLIVLVVCGLLSIAAAVLRFRRTTGIERAQMKWLAFAAVVFAVLLLLSTRVPPDYGWLGDLLFTIGASLIPLSCGLAILRYRLYDIDRIVSRTASYAIVTGALLATYAVIVTSATRLLPDSSKLAVATATLVAAALARPLYRRVQHSVDRRFNRARYDAEHTVDAFGVRLRQEIHPESVRDELVTTVAETLQPASVRLWRP